MKLLGMVLTVFMALSIPLLAQPERQFDEPGRRPLRGVDAPRERIEEYKKMKLIETLELEEEAAVRFFAKYDKHEKEQQAVHREMMETVNGIEKMVRENSADAEFERAFARLGELEQKLDEERQRFLKDLREILTVQQIGKLIVFERNFAQRVQEIVREMKRERRMERE